MSLSSTYPVNLLCSLLNCSRSSFYYAPVEHRDDQALVTAVETLQANKPYLGYRMMLARLRRAGWQCSERQVRRILRSLKRTRSAGRVTTTESRHAHPRFPNLIAGITASCPDEIWVADLTYLRYGHQYLYLAVVLDLFTRAVRGWHLEEMMTCEALTKPALQMALAQGTPTWFHSDQGRQYAARDHVALLKSVGATVSMSDAGQPTQNAFIERFIKTLKYEHVYYSEYENLVDMRRQLRHFLEVEYNCERPHSSLGYVTPAEHETAYVSRQAFFSDH